MYNYIDNFFKSSSPQKVLKSDLFDKDFIRVNLIASGDPKTDSETYIIRLIGETLEEQKKRLELLLKK